MSKRRMTEQAEAPRERRRQRDEARPHYTLGAVEGRRRHGHGGAASIGKGWPYRQNVERVSPTMDARQQSRARRRQEGGDVFMMQSSAGVGSGSSIPSETRRLSAFRGRFSRVLVRVF